MIVKKYSKLIYNEMANNICLNNLVEQGYISNQNLKTNIKNMLFYNIHFIAQAFFFEVLKNIYLASFLNKTALKYSYYQFIMTIWGNTKNDKY